MSKYYTPSIEEFHIGFEYEYSYDDGKIWLNSTCSFIDMPELEDIFNEGNPNETILRVKYLDKEDIESLGFELNKYNSFWYRYTDQAVCVEITMKDIVVEIIEEDSTDEYTKRYFLFKGKIKNKSEFKQLLKRVGIKV